MSSSLMAVSYTHLDVYKRQLHNYGTAAIVEGGDSSVYKGRMMRMELE